jgi:hypothetical protein
MSFPVTDAQFSNLVRLFRADNELARLARVSNNLAQWRCAMMARASRMIDLPLDTSVPLKSLDWRKRDDFELLVACAAAYIADTGDRAPELATLKRFFSYIVGCGDCESGRVIPDTVAIAMVWRGAVYYDWTGAAEALACDRLYVGALQWRSEWAEPGKLCGSAEPSISDEAPVWTSSLADHLLRGGMVRGSVDTVNRLLGAPVFCNAISCSELTFAQQSAAKALLKLRQKARENAGGLSAIDGERAAELSRLARQSVAVPTQQVLMDLKLAGSGMLETPEKLSAAAVLSFGAERRALAAALTILRRRSTGASGAALLAAEAAASVERHIVAVDRESAADVAKTTTFERTPVQLAPELPFDW